MCSSRLRSSHTEFAGENDRDGRRWRHRCHFVTDHDVSEAALHDDNGWLMVEVGQGGEGGRWGSDGMLMSYCLGRMFTHVIEQKHIRMSSDASTKGQFGCRRQSDRRMSRQAVMCTYMFS